MTLLGHLEILRSGLPVTGFTSNKVQALLFYLAVTARPHLRPALAGLLWGELPEASAHNNLRKALSILHRLAGPHLDIRRDSVTFNRDSAYWLDVEAFENGVGRAAGTAGVEGLEKAVALYRDDFLAGFYVHDAPAFEEWALAERARLRMLALEALHTLAVHYSRLGEEGRAAAMAYTTRLLALEPWHEEAHRQLMLLLAAGGQRSAALAQYETCRRLLAEELGVEPDRETTALYEQIRDGLPVALPSVPPPPAFVTQSAQAAAAERPVFAGRRRELAQLDGLLDQALAGGGRVAFITGEPGSGKTILAQEFVRQAMDAHPELLAAGGRCNAYTGIGDPYLPFLEILQMLTGDVEARWAGGAITGDHARRLWALMPDAVQALTDDGPELIDRFVPGAGLLARARTGAPRQATALSELLERRAASGPGPARLQQTDLFEQYTKVMAALSRQHPLILVVDDLQWADAGSIGLLFHLGRRLAGSRILLLGAYRPGDVALGRPAAGSASERHPLEPVLLEFQRDLGDIYVDLAKAEGREFVDALLDSVPNRLDAGFREVLFRHTGGHPLFTVELLRGLQEHGNLIQDDSGRWIEGPTLDWETLPPRVEAVIAEGLGRLPEDWQSMLSVASVEGEEFTAEAVARVQGIDEGQVVQWLSGPLSRQHYLILGQGVQRLGGQRLSRYRFRHFLFQKYLYGNLDPVRRADLHEAMGNALETLYREGAGELALPLARHFEAAGMTAKAVDHLLEAGNRAARLFANEEAIAHYRRGIELIGTQPDTPQRDRMELALQLALGVPLIAIRGFSGEELGQVYGRARELARRAKASFELFQALSGMKAYYDVRAELKVARQLSEELLRLAQELDDPGLIAMAHHAISATQLYLGQPVGFLEQRERMSALYDAERDRPLVYRLALDARLASMYHAGLAYWFLGYPDQARQLRKDAVDLAREWKHPFLLSFSLMFAAFSSVYQREVQAARQNAEETIALASEHGHPLWLGGGMATLGWALGEEGEPDDGIAHILRGQAMARAIGARLGYLQELCLLADTYRKAGRVSDGLAAVDEALALVQATKTWMDEPEIHRLKGELLLMQGGAELEAEGCFRRAVEVAQKQEARSWELRATMSLCRLWQKQGKAREARQMLKPIYGWFTEGFDTPDLKDARALLDALV